MTKSFIPSHLFIKFNIKKQSILSTGFNYIQLYVLTKKLLISFNIVNILGIIEKLPITYFNHLDYCVYRTAGV